MLAVGIVMVAVQLSIIVHVMSFLHDSKGIALVDGAWVLFAAQAAGVPGRIVLARWSDHTRSGRVGPLAVALVAAAAAAAAAPWIPGSLAAWLVFASVAGFFSFGWYGPWVVGVAETASGAPLGMTLAAAMTANQISIVLAPPLFGLIFDLTGSWTASWTVLATVVGLVAWHLVRRRLSVGPAAATSQTGSVG